MLLLMNQSAATSHGGSVLYRMLTAEQGYLFKKPYSRLNCPGSSIYADHMQAKPTVACSTCSRTLGDWVHTSLDTVGSSTASWAYRLATCWGSFVASALFQSSNRDAISSRCSRPSWVCQCSRTGRAGVG